MRTRRFVSNGYLYICLPKHPGARKDGYVAFHRYIMSKKLGRALKRDELVHHINGNKADNRIQNLMIVKGIGTHVAAHNGHELTGEFDTSENQRMITQLLQFA
jgi:hypothetical protein